MSRTDEIKKAIKAIPALPVTAVKLLDRARDPDVDISELVETLEYDPGLTSNVLHLANSAYFGGTGKVKSIRGAIIRLGLKRLTQLVVASSVAPLARSALKGYDLRAGELLDHLVGAAVCTDQLSEKLKLPETDYAFTAALLHDIGKIVLGGFVAVDGDVIIKLAFEEEVPFNEAEKQALGIDHAEAGAILLESWNFPPETVGIIRWHHEPDRFQGENLAMDLVHTADNLCYMAGIGTGADGLNYRPSESVAQRLNLKPLVTEEIISLTLSRLDEVKELLRTLA